MMSKNIFAYFLGGISAGIGIGMLIAPRSGEQVRRSIKDQAHKTSGHIKESVASLKDSAVGLVTKSKRTSADRLLDQDALGRMHAEGGPVTSEVVV